MQDKDPVTTSINYLSLLLKYESVLFRNNTGFHLNLGELQRALLYLTKLFNT